MATNYNPKIITNGLVLCLDAANPRSYPGSGTIWKDLSGNGNDGTLVNGVGHNTDSQGAMLFDGVNDYCEIINRNELLEFQPTKALTLSVWFKTSTTAVGGAIISNMISAAPYSGYDLWFNGSNQMALHLISSWSTDATKVKVDYAYSNFLNKWVNMTVTYDGSCPTTLPSMLSSTDFYINGNLYTTGKAEGSVGVDGFNASDTSISYSVSQRFRVASRWSSNTFSQGSSITTSGALVYNRKLVESEIKQNFEATRDRYGV